MKQTPLTKALDYIKNRLYKNDPYIIGALVYKTLENYVNTMIKASLHNSQMVEDKFDEITLEVLNSIYNEYIVKLDWSSEEHLDALSKLDPGMFDHSIKLMLDFYERKEVYEKCAVLYKLYAGITVFREKSEKSLVGA